MHPASIPVRLAATCAAHRYISRLRNDLSDGTRELLQRLPADLAEPRYLKDVLAATLVAGLYPNVAWLRRYGKGETCSGLKVGVRRPMRHSYCPLMST